MTTVYQLDSIGRTLYYKVAKNGVKKRVSKYKLTPQQIENAIEIKTTRSSDTSDQEILESVQASIERAWNVEPELIEKILKIAKLLKKNQWIKVMGEDFVLDFEYKQTPKKTLKPKGAYFSKGDWFLLVKTCTRKLAVVDINDANIITLKILDK